MEVATLRFNGGGEDILVPNVNNYRVLKGSQQGIAQFDPDCRSGPTPNLDLLGQHGRPRGPPATPTPAPSLEGDPLAALAGERLAACGP
ncbi:hypothetical protein NL676_025776 [Syzygium grande]|nr:hypothetical protein NL676_025776 [Syzygium grande]